MDSKDANNRQDLHFKVHHNDFERITGSEPKIELLLENLDFPFAHEAGVFIASTNELFITSNRLTDGSGKPEVRISKVILGSRPVTCEDVQCEKIRMGNGGVNYEDGILFCAQGSASSPSGLFKMSKSPPHQVEEILTSFYGRPFNSVNDVVIHGDGSIWFTDPIYGFDYGFRCKPQLPNQVYRFDPKSGSVRAMADGFGRPNGICFSPDETTVYITDTDWEHGDGSHVGSLPATM